MIRSRYRLGILGFGLVLLGGLVGATPAAAAGSYQYDMYNGSLVRYQQPDYTACVGASTLMMLNFISAATPAGELYGFGWTPTTSYAVQENILAYARANDLLLAASVGSDPTGWRDALNYYGWGAEYAGVYRDQSFASFDSALKAAVSDLARFHLPVGLLMEGGSHAEILNGYQVSGDDPASGSQNFTVTGIYLTDPLAGDAHRDYYASTSVLLSTGVSDLSFSRFAWTDSPYRDPLDGLIGKNKWYGKWVIEAPLQAGLPIPAPTVAQALPPLATSPSFFTPIAPTRLVDTRINLGLAGKFISGVARSLQVVGLAGVPADATAVVVNLTVTNQSSLGYLALTTLPTNAPGTSTLNFPLGDNRANGATVPIAPDGTISLTFIGTAAGASTDVVMDLTGAYSPTAASSLTAIAPTRLVDTRINLGLAGKFISGVARSLQVVGLAGVPADATAVVVNLTVTNQSSLGYLALTTLPTNAPGTSTLNFPLGDNRANGATVPIAPDGTISLTFIGTAAGASTDVVMDLTGAYSPKPSLTFTPLNPTRFLDTRINLGLSYKFLAGQARRLQIAGIAGVPTNAVAIAVNLTVTTTITAGYLALTTVPTNAPGTSTLNFPQGDIRANNAVTALNSDGTVSITLGAPAGSSVDVIMDVVGSFGP